MMFAVVSVARHIWIITRTVIRINLHKQISKFPNIYFALKFSFPPPLRSLCLSFIDKLQSWQKYICNRLYNFNLINRRLKPNFEIFLKTLFILLGSKVLSRLKAISEEFQNQINIAKSLERRRKKISSVFDRSKYIWMNAGHFICVNIYFSKTNAFLLVSEG